jgi:transcriptional regulator with XRE-family HTH domain
MPKTIHQGHNIKRFREMMGIKQDSLAFDLGEGWNQKKISMLEQKEVIDAGLLQQIADVLKVPEEAIKNFDEETAMMNIQHNYEGSNPNNHGTIGANNYNFNPIDKLMEAMEEIKKLYEALLKSEREKNALLERLLAEKK